MGNQKQAALNSVPKEQSPAIIILLKNMELASVILVYDAGVLTSLEAVEAILHGELEEYKAATQFGRILHTAVTSRTIRN